MIQICAWCQQEDQGKIQAQKEKNPLEQISHGICRDHARSLRNGYHRTNATSPLRPLPRNKPFLILQMIFKIKLKSVQIFKMV